MDDYISKQLVMDAVWACWDECEALEKAIEKMPAADVVPMETYKQTAWERDAAIEQLEELGYSFGEKVRRGHWELQDDENAKAYGWHICSECGIHVGEPTSYCPDCGTKMEL